MHLVSLRLPLSLVSFFRTPSSGGRHSSFFFSTSDPLLPSSLVTASFTSSEHAVACRELACHSFVSSQSPLSPLSCFVPRAPVRDLTADQSSFIPGTSLAACGRNLREIDNCRSPSCPLCSSRLLVRPFTQHLHTCHGYSDIREVGKYIGLLSVSDIHMTRLYLSLCLRRCLLPLSLCPSLHVSLIRLSIHFCSSLSLRDQPTYPSPFYPLRDPSSSNHAQMVPISSAFPQLPKMTQARSMESRVGRTHQRELA